MDVLLWHLGVESVDALPEETARSVERAALEGSAVEIIAWDRQLTERAGPITARAKQAVIAAHSALLPLLHSELEKARALVSPLYSAYGCDLAEVAEISPVRMILRAIDDSEKCAAGDFFFDYTHVASELPTWL
jgi:hypothetical protein